MKMKFALVAIVAMFVFSGCDDDDSEYKCSSCANQPEALAVNDDSGKGIYKGVLIGSSGTIKFDIDNQGDGDYTAVITIGGDEFELTSSSSFGEGGFEGCFVNEAAEISICILISSDGSEWEITNIQIPLHEDVIMTLYKEFSDQLVEVFEGTYDGDASGIFNMVIYRDEDDNGYWQAISRSDNEEPDGYYDGDIADDEILGAGGEITISGELDDDTVKGAWQGIGTVENGTWKGKRTL